MSRKVALVTGVTGQDGAFLTQFLIQKGYMVYGLKRRTSLFNTQRVDHLYQDPHEKDIRFLMHYGDLTDSGNVVRIVSDTAPDEIYNLGAQSHVKVSFDSPEYTANVDALGTLRILEAIRLLGLAKKTRFYQASSSELFGNSLKTPQDETTPFVPRSPYACAKLFAYWITVNYREAYGMFAANGILFNHESPIRGETFVTRKITRAAARIALGLQQEVFLGNLDARRDWGHARDFVRAQWLILQQDKPDDFVIATGEQRSVREFCGLAFKKLGMDLEWTGAQTTEQGRVAAFSPSPLLERYAAHCGLASVKPGTPVVRVDPEYFRPTEVNALLGDAAKARQKLGWTPTVSFEDLVGEMVENDLRDATREAICRRDGFPLPSCSEARM